METLFTISKILVSLLFFVTSFVMIYLCFKANYLKEEFYKLEKLIKKDLVKIYETGSTVTKLVIELVLARYSFDIGKLIKN